MDPESLALSGHFKIGRLLGDGQWRIVSPEDTVLATWLRDAGLWLLGVALLSIPAAWLVAAWLSAPFRAFGAAAERLGRDPRAVPLDIDGPAEIRGAARAFNEMSGRLARYVDDRVTMMAAIAHDLRTPITRLSFHLERAPEGVRARAETDIEEMRSMLSALLSFVQTLQGNRPRQRQELRSLVTSIVSEQADLGQDVTIEDGPELVLLGDHLGLRSLFTNLIDNALAYGGRARVSLRREGAFAIVEVEDDGPGLPASELERVFEPFYRVEPSRSRRTGGMGLGLALVRSVAVSHGGHAELENKVGHGLRARVVLPI